MDHENKKELNTIRKLLALMKFALLISIVVGIPAIIWFQYPELIDHFSSFEKADDFLKQYQTQSAFVYIGLQVLQIVISVIPGQPIQFASGYAFGLAGGYALSFIGIGLGTVITYYLGRLLGKDMVYLIFGEERLERFMRAINSKKGLLIIFLIYLFPGIPKDLFAYAAGISKLRCLPFVFLSLTARTPALMCSLAIGKMFRNQSYVGIIVVAVIVLLVAVLAIIFRKRFLSFIDRMYEPTPKE
jgi:uncharacterized membrane protein YdjX (TVP38/TMEM64 family)